MDAQGEFGARFVTGQGLVEIGFERRFEHGVESVWRALTDPALLPQWLAPGRIELRLGGAARLDFGDSGIVIDSAVSACDPTHLLEYSWSGPGEETLRPLRWRLEPAEVGCRLSLTLRIPEGEDAARSAAGWEAHLDMLAAALEGVPVKFPFERFKAAREAYRNKLADAGDQDAA
jgi:uncharacterized protein YndB with AHSA1/START domain